MAPEEQLNESVEQVPAAAEPIPAGAEDVAAAEPAVPVEGEAAPEPETDWQGRLAELTSRAERAEAETEITRADLNRKITALTLKLDAANQQSETARAGVQNELDKAQEEVARLQADNARLKEDAELYKQMGDGQQEAVRKLMDRASHTQAAADAANRKAQSYILLSVFILLVAVAAVGICVLIVLKLLGY